MEYIVVSVYDRTAEAFGRPIYALNKNATIRDFIDECERNSPENLMYRHPDHFNLVLLGKWDDSNGKFTEEKERPTLIEGRQVKTRAKMAFAEGHGES